MQYLISKIRSYSFRGIIILLPLLIACVEVYDLETDEYKNLLVINGSIIKEDSIQVIEIYRTAPVENPEIIPVSDCHVNVVNGKGEKFYFNETSPGIYEAAIPEQHLQFNEKFKLQLTAPDGNEYTSQYESILQSSPVDSVYHLNESYQSSSTYSPTGLQYYVDIKAPDGFTKNYRWDLEETWEYHVPGILQAYFIVTGEGMRGPIGYYEILPESFSNPVCWTTKTINSLYSSSTQNLTINEKKKIPLNHVSGTNVRLNVKYSLLVKQYALSDSAYLYWNQNQVEARESGGLYQSQPSQAISNIRNINNPEEKVLGFFWASSFTEKRVFYKGPFGGYFINCPVVDFVLGEDYNGNWTKDFLYDQNGNTNGDLLNPYPPIPFWGIVDEYCFDCTAHGGTTIKPDFWDD